MSQLFKSKYPEEKGLKLEVVLITTVKAGLFKSKYPEEKGLKHIAPDSSRAESYCLRANIQKRKD